MGRFGELAVDVSIDGVKHVGSHMPGTDRHQHGICHGLLIKVFKAVLRQKNVILLLHIAHLDGLAVARPHFQLLGAVSGRIHVNHPFHTRCPCQRIINGAKLLKIQMGVIMILNFVGQIKIFINSISHYPLPPYNSLYSSGCCAENA